ncbi:hypothetical protein ACJX0J_019707, partial [Zea mays]
MAAIVAVVRGMQQGLLAQVVVVVTAVIGLTLVSIVGKWKQNILAAIVGTLFPCACARLILDFAKRTLPHIKKSWHNSPMLILVWLTYKVDTIFLIAMPALIELLYVSVVM